MRVGIGYDVHRLGEGRKMIIGGVEIPYELGLIGHSDADVLLHAIMDALLGAAALGDIGKHFPDTDERYRDISSLKLLGIVADLIADNGFIIENIDATIIAQKPKMRPYIDEMRFRISETLGIEVTQVNVKATTEEGLGFTGNGEGISSQAVCMLSAAADLRDESIAVAAGANGEVVRPCGSCSGCFAADLADKGTVNRKKTVKKEKDSKKDKKTKKKKK